jgi:hypothetical protein
MIFTGKKLLTKVGSMICQLKLMTLKITKKIQIIYKTVMLNTIVQFFENDDAERFETLPNMPVYFLSLACRYGSNKIIEVILKKNPTIITPTNGAICQSLVLAAEHGHVEVIKILLKHGLSPFVNNNLAIQKACEIGHTEVVKILLENNSVTPCVNNCYPVIISIQRNHDEIVKLFMQDRRVCEHPKFNALYEFFKCKNYINIKDVFIVEDILELISQKLAMWILFVEID